MIGGEALEKDERDQSFQMVNICVPPKVPHWLQVLGSLMGTRPSFPLAPCLCTCRHGLCGREAELSSSRMCLCVSLPHLPHCGVGEGACTAALVWRLEESTQVSSTCF